MYLVYGLEKSGKSIIFLLHNQNKKFKVWDDNKLVRKSFKKKYGAEILIKPTKKNLNFFKKVFVSPGITIRQKIFQLKNKSFEVNRDLNLYYENLVNQKIIAVTGTNGKSTTTKLIGDILKENKIEAFVGGNIGEPLCDAFIKDKKYNYHVIELSSFQLETIKNFNADISIITNLSSDHLDRYDNITDYINQKKNIITKIGVNLFSIDDKYSKKIFLQKKIKNKISFSLKDKCADFYIGEGYILDNYFKKGRKLFLKNISDDLKEDFNNQNILISYICSKLFKLKQKSFFKVVKNFRGLPFRSSIIFNNTKLKIINNSKSTNINSTLNSIKNNKRIYLILGGVAKEKNFETLLDYKDRIISVYVFGKSRLLIEKKLNKIMKVKSFKKLNFVIKQIFIDLNNNSSSRKSCILFAPGCTSFDQYKNFEERGKNFSDLIRKYIKTI